MNRSSRSAGGTGAGTRSRTRTRTRTEDSAAAARRRAEIRAYARTHHPDRGGDPAEFAAGLLALRSAPIDGPGGPSGASDGGRGRTDLPWSARPTVYRRQSRFGGLVTRVRGAARRRAQPAHDWWLRRRADSRDPPRVR